MANVDKFERLFKRATEHFLVQNQDLYSEAVDKLVAITDSERPRIYKKRDREFIEKKITEVAGYIRSQVGIGTRPIVMSDEIAPDSSKAHLRPPDNDNRSGSDFTVSFNKTEYSFELKLGQATDVAAGIKQVHGNLIKAPSKITTLLESKDQLRKMWLSGNGQAAEKLRYEALDTAYQENSKHIGECLSSNGQLIMNSYLAGITSGDEIFSGITPRKVTRLTTTAKGVNVEACSFQNRKDWIVAGVEHTSRNRFNYFISSQSAQAVFKITLNWKNSYVLSNGVKVKARYGLGTASYNVWKTKPGSKAFKKYINTPQKTYITEQR